MSDWPPAGEEWRARTPEIDAALERNEADDLRRRGYIVIHPEATDLPLDLAALLCNPKIVLERDKEIQLADGRTLWEHLEEWKNAPTGTASA